MRPASLRAQRLASLVEEVLRVDPGYYSWMMSGDFPLNTKQKLTEIRMRLK